MKIRNFAFINSKVIQLRRAILGRVLVHQCQPLLLNGRSTKEIAANLYEQCDAGFYAKTTDGCHLLKVRLSTLVSLRFHTCTRYKPSCQTRILPKSVTRMLVNFELPTSKTGMQNYPTAKSTISLNRLSISLGIRFSMSLIFDAMSYRTSGSKQFFTVESFLTISLNALPRGKFF